MAIPTLLLPFDGSLAGRDRSGVVTPVASGPVRFTDGASPASQAYIAEEGTTNLLSNPSAELSEITGSNTSGNSATITRDTSRAWSGTSSFKYVGGGVTSTLLLYTSASLNYTGSVRTFIASAYVVGTVDVARLRVNYTDGTNTYTDYRVGGTYADWTRLTTTTLASDPAKVVNFLAIEFRGAASATFWVDGAQIEEKPYATSYCDGSLGSGYTWAGMAHASASVRAASSVSIPYPEPFGEAAIRYSEDDGQTWQTAFLAAPGTIGTRGTLGLAAGILTLSAGRAVRYDALLIFDRPLTTNERTTLVNAPTWRWDTLIPRVGGILRIGVPSQVGGLLRGDDQSGVGGIMRIGGG